MDAIIKAITEQLKPFAASVVSARKWFAFWERNGMHIMPVSFYSPIPELKSLSPTIWQRRSSMPGIDMNTEFQLLFLQEVIPQYRSEYVKFARHATENKFEFHYDNNQFIGLDPIVLHCIVRHYRPRRVIEIGGGSSTLVTAAAVRLNGSGDIFCIEPYPGNLLKEGVTGVRELISQKVEDIPVGFFQQLGLNDILFIDSTHVAKIGSDVQYLFLEVLPQLRPGVLIHIHDIFFPNDYPEMWIREKNFFWNEQYMLQAFLIGNTMFRVHFCAPYLGKLHGDHMVKIFPDYSPGMGGGSFWMRRV